MTKPPEWHNTPACTQIPGYTELHPDDATTICHTCPALHECREWMLTDEIHHHTRHQYEATRHQGTLVYAGQTLIQWLKELTPKKAA